MSFVVPMPGKVEPFWVSKLVADKVEVPLTPHPVSDEPDHLVECQATANDVVGWPQPITSELRDMVLILEWEYHCLTWTFPCTSPCP